MIERLPPNSDAQQSSKVQAKITELLQKATKRVSDYMGLSRATASLEAYAENTKNEIPYFMPEFTEFQANQPRRQQ